MQGEKSVGAAGQEESHIKYELPSIESFTSNPNQSSDGLAGAMR